MDIVHSYTAAVRGFHFYKQFRKPVEKKKNCAVFLKNSTYTTSLQ